MAPSARSKFGAPIFEPEVFRKQMYSTEESTCDIVGTFRHPAVIRRLRVIRRPRSNSAPGNCVPLAP